MPTQNPSKKVLVDFPSNVQGKRQVKEKEMREQAKIGSKSSRGHNFILDKLLDSF
jgi:hypothetical protein